MAERERYEQPIVEWFVASIEEAFGVKFHFTDKPDPDYQRTPLPELRKSRV